MSVVQAVVAAVRAAVVAEFPGYQVEAREPVESEMLPRQVWIVLGDIEPTLDVADGGQTIGLAVSVYVTALFDVSDTEAHYRTVMERRIGTFRALQRAARDTPDVLLTPQMEGSYVTEGLQVASASLRIEWDEPVPEEP